MELEGEFHETWGNVVSVDTIVGGRLGWRAPKTTVLLFGKMEFSSERTREQKLQDPDGHVWDENSQFANAMMGHLRVTRRVSKRWSLEAFGQAEYDEFLLLIRRTLIGSGPRLSLLHTDPLSLKLGTAYMLENELLDKTVVDEKPETLAHRWSSYMSAKGELGAHVGWDATLYIQPRLTDFNDFRLLVAATLSVALKDQLEFQLEFESRLDNKPTSVQDGFAELLPFNAEFTQAFVLLF